MAPRGTTGCAAGGDDAPPVLAGQRGAVLAEGLDVAGTRLPQPVPQFRGRCTRADRPADGPLAATADDGARAPGAEADRVQVVLADHHVLADLVDHRG